MFKEAGFPCPSIEENNRKLIFENEETLDELYENSKKFKEFIDSRKIYRDIFKIARKICGLLRQTTLHAAGMCLGNDSLYNYLPLYEHDTNTLATQYDLNYIESIG